MAENNQFPTSFLSGAQPLSYLNNPPQSGAFTSSPPQTTPARPFNPFSIEAIQQLGAQAQSQPLVPFTNVTGIGQPGPVSPDVINQYIPRQREVSFDPFRGQTINESQLKPDVIAANPLRFIPGVPQTFSFLNPLGVGDMLKGAIETPERFFASIRRIPAIIRAGGNPAAVPTKKEGEVGVKSYFREFLDMQSDLESTGFDSKTAALASFLSAGGSAILDAVFVGGVLENAAKSVLARVPVAPKEVQVAFDFLGKPTTIEEAETTYKALQRQFHPDMPNGDARVSAQLNNAITVLRESGIPQQTGKIAQGARTAAETLLKPVSELTATPKGGTPFAGIKGLLPEQAGYRPTQPFQPQRQPVFGLSVRDVGLTKEGIGGELTTLAKTAESSGTYEKFLSNVMDDLAIAPEKVQAIKDAGFGTLKEFYNEAVKEVIPKGVESLAQGIGRFKSAEEFADKVFPEIKAVSQIDETVAKIKIKHPNDQLFVIEKDLDRLAARLFEKYPDEIPKDLNKFLRETTVRDLETGEILSGVEGLRGGHIGQLRQSIENLPLQTKSQLKEFYEGAVKEATSRQIAPIVDEAYKAIQDSGGVVGGVPEVSGGGEEVPEFIRRKLEAIGGKEGVTPPSIPPGSDAELEALLAGEGEKGVFGKFVNKVRSIFAPAKTLDEESRVMFDNWRNNLLKSKQIANQESLKLREIAGADGLKTILDYQAGRPTPYTKAIREAFDDAYINAVDRGFEDLNYVSNYLPQVYDNSLAEIKKAVATYMQAEGVPAKDIVKYLKENEALFGDPAVGLRTAARFSKGRFIPDYETAIQYGLTPKYDHPAELLAYWREQLETSLVNKEFIKQLSEAGKILPSGMNPVGWKEVNIPFSALKVYAEPNLANVLNGIFADPAASGLLGIFARSFAGLSRRAQELALSAGIPKTTVNFYAMIQTLKQMTAGNVKAIVPFVRANFEKASAEYFIQKHPTIMKMASNGVDLGNTIADWNKLYKTSLNSRIIGDTLGESFDKSFNEKTFNSFIPQLQIGIFEQAEKRFLSRGIPADKAAQMAADTVRASEGLIPDLGRSKLTKDTMTAIFFAPRFREGIIRTTANLFRGITTEFNNPAFYMNRRLIAGLALTYATMNYLNKKLSGDYMWNNPEYHEFDLKYTVDKKAIEKYGLEGTGIKEGDVIYIPWFPGFTSTIRNVSFGVKDVLTGDFNRGQRELGSLFSISAKLIWEILGNKDYFGNSIYKDTDTLANKLKKIALYVHLQADHPFVRGLGDIIEGDKPMYQTFSKALELPLKFSSQDKISQQQFYNAVDELNADKAEARQSLQSTYEQIKSLTQAGDKDGARAILNVLTDEQYEVYKDILANDKRAQTISQKSKIYDEYKKIKQLTLDGRKDEARAMVNAMSDEEYRAYELLLNQFED